MELILAKKVIPTRERKCAREGRSLIAQLIAGASCDKRGSAPPRTHDPDRRAMIHEGSHSGQLRAAIVFLAGIFPTIFAVAGIIMWLRKCQKCRGATTPR